MKPASEPTSSRPKPCASLKKPHEHFPFAAPCWSSYVLSILLRYFTSVLLYKRNRQITIFILQYVEILPRTEGAILHDVRG